MSGLYALLDVILPYQWLSPLFMKNAFLAVLVASVLFGTLGTFVVSNRMSFFSDAIGHSSLAGIALGAIVGSPDVTLSMVAFSLVLGALIVAVKVKGKAASDTVIGVFSSTAVALGIVILSAGSGFAKWQGYLVGDVLSITPRQIVLLCCCALLVLAVWALLYNRMLLVSLHPSFAKSRGVHTFAVELLFALLTALVVTVSIRWTGLLVVNSMLVLPAASSRLVSKSCRSYLACSLSFSLVSGVAGLCLSYYMETAAGASIVLVNAIVFALCFAFGALKGRALKG